MISKPYFSSSMGPAEANRKTVDNIKRYIDAKSEQPIDRSKTELLEKHGFKDNGANYETYIKVTIPKTVYDQAVSGEDLKVYLIEQLLKLIKD